MYFCFMQNISIYKKAFEDYLVEYNFEKEPRSLYEPIKYILNLGGKRLRPVLTLLSADIFSGQVNKALDAALAIEMFHNFSLIHDDIMDDAPTRRGKPTVHEKWNTNTAILSGDALLVMANKALETYDPVTFFKLTTLFNKTALEVCEGQQYDFDFESLTTVTSEEYVRMITLKTSVLIATALKFGAIIASASPQNSEAIYSYGLNLGIAFQLQDDYLDVFGTSDFGKQKAGDIIANKKTILYIKAMALAESQDRDRLVKLYQLKGYNEQKMKEVIAVFKKYKIAGYIEREIAEYTQKAVQSIDSLTVGNKSKEVLRILASDLMCRVV